MSAHPNFKMVVNNLLAMPPRGMLVRGKVEGGALHVGDAVQVGNGQSVKTVEIGMISPRTLGGDKAKYNDPDREDGPFRRTLEGCAETAGGCLSEERMKVFSHDFGVSVP